MPGVVPLCRDPLQGLAHELELALHHLRRHPPGPLFVPAQAHLQGHVEGQHHHGRPAAAGQGPQLRPRTARHRGAVRHRHPAQLQAVSEDLVEQLEGTAADRHVRLVVRDHGPAPVAAHHLGLPEVAAGEGGLPAARGPHEHHQRPRRDHDPHVTPPARAPGVGRPAGSARTGTRPPQPAPRTRLPPAFGRAPGPGPPPASPGPPSSPGP